MSDAGAPPEPESETCAEVEAVEAALEAAGGERTGPDEIEGPNSA